MKNRPTGFSFRRSIFVLGLFVSLTFFSSNAWALFINEFHYDNVGTDAGEFIEFAGPAGSISGWRLVLYNGFNGEYYNNILLSGSIPDQQSGFGTLSLFFSTNGIQNGGPDGMALVDPGNTVVQFLSYEGVFTADDGPADEMTSTDIGFRESGSTPIGYSLQLVGTGNSLQGFTWQSARAATSNSINASQTFISVPEPGLVVLVGLGLMCVGFVHRLKHS